MLTTISGAGSMKAELVNKDGRGSITVYSCNNVEIYTLLETRRGYARGGDYHATEQHALLLKGEAAWILKVPDGRGGSEFVTRPHGLNEDFVVPPGIPHGLVARTDCVLLKWQKGGRFVQHIDGELRAHMLSLRR
jgi:hypothetical protein